MISAIQRNSKGLDMPARIWVGMMDGFLREHPMTPEQRKRLCEVGLQTLDRVLREDGTRDEEFLKILFRAMRRRGEK